MTNTCQLLRISSRIFARGVVDSFAPVPCRSRDQGCGRGNRAPVTLRLSLERLLSSGLAWLLAFSPGCAGYGAAVTTVPPFTVASPGEALSSREMARNAQRLFREGKYGEAADAYLAAARQASRKDQIRYRYNAAVAYYRSGQYSEAAALWRDLALSPAGDPYDAASALGLALYRAAETVGATNEAARLEQRARLLEQAADAWAEAARRHPDRDTLRKNLGVVLHKLPEAREQAKISRLLEQYGRVPPSELLDQMLRRQREILQRSPAAFTNTSPDRILALEQLGAEQESLADLWIPLQAGLTAALASSSGTNVMPQAAALHSAVEMARTPMREAAAAFRDLDPSAHRQALAAEAGLYALWKALAPYPLVLREDLRLQTNVVGALSAEEHPGPSETLRFPQEEATTLTKLFQERFVTAVPEEGLLVQQTPAPLATPGATNQIPVPLTNAPLLTAETRAKILALADAAWLAQSNAWRALERSDPQGALAPAREAERCLREIEALLPRSPQPSSPPEESSPSEQSSEEEQLSQPQEAEEEQPSPAEPTAPSEAASSPPQEDTDKLDERQLRAMIEKVFQRTHDYEQRARQRRQYIPPSPIERDW